MSAYIMAVSIPRVLKRVRTVSVRMDVSTRIPVQSQSMAQLRDRATLMENRKCIAKER